MAEEHKDVPCLASPEELLNFPVDWLNQRFKVGPIEARVFTTTQNRVVCDLVARDGYRFRDGRTRQQRFVGYRFEAYSCPRWMKWRLAAIVASALRSLVRDRMHRPRPYQVFKEIVELYRCGHDRASIRWFVKWALRLGKMSFKAVGAAIMFYRLFSGLPNAIYRAFRSWWGWMLSRARASWSTRARAGPPRSGPPPPLGTCP